tara:strand:- start:944 stop:1678 length:735 start_codon:yes stop_codon:yes gene_type:complete
MAYNNLSGTVFLPDKLTTRLSLASGSIISGNLDYSNAENVINVPRVTNANDNSLVTNVASDANTFTCESNLTFDGGTLNVVGDITASVGISASIFVGDGSQLTGISGSGAQALGPTDSVQLKQEGGNVSGSNALLFQNNILAIGGGLRLSRRSTMTSITASTNDYYIGLNSTNGPLSVTLPSAGLLGDGQAYVLKDEGGAANTHNITITASGSQTIDGQNSIVLESPYASVQLYCNGNDKFYIY